MATTMKLFSSGHQWVPNCHINDIFLNLILLNRCKTDGISSVFCFKVWVPNPHVNLNFLREHQMRIWNGQLCFATKKDFQHYTEPKPKTAFSSKTSCSCFNFHFLLQSSRLQISVIYDCVFIFSILQFWKICILKYPLVLTHPFQNSQCQVQVSHLDHLNRTAFNNLILLQCFPFSNHPSYYYTTWIISLKCRFVPTFFLIKKEKFYFLPIITK